MPSKTFTIHAGDDGTAHFSLTYRDPRQSGISRLSCDLSAVDVVKLVLFSEAASLHREMAANGQSEVELEGLFLSHDPSRDALWIERKVGFSTQTTEMPFSEFHTSMAEVTDICLTRARDSKHGEAIAEFLNQSTRIEALEFTHAPDDADQVHHRINEIALILLADDACRRGSDLGRKLRGKKTLEEARSHVISLVETLAAELLPANGLSEAERA